MGGTCLHIVYGLNRFSEDLDFDNFGLTDNEIKNIIKKVSTKLIKEGIYNTLRYSEHQKEVALFFPELLQDLHISGHKEENLRINIDYDNKERIVQTETFLLSRFEIIQRIVVNKLSVIFAQKILAVAFRKRPIPRDFYDIIWLISRSVLPDYEYLEKNSIKSNEVKDILLEKYDKLNKKQMINELAPFLFNKDDIKKLDFFREIVKKI
jgi:predicted nucleotidyltransferase component of viral defense system